MYCVMFLGVTLLQRSTATEMELGLLVCRPSLQNICLHHADQWLMTKSRQKKRTTVAYIRICYKKYRQLLQKPPYSSFHITYNLDKNSHGFTKGSDHPPSILQSVHLQMSFLNRHSGRCQHTHTNTIGRCRVFLHGDKYAFQYAHSILHIRKTSTGMML